jgi:glucose/arabinose dehydrogenase
MLSSLFLLLFILVVSRLYGTHSTNVTFVPKPIRITVADLPAPVVIPHIDQHPIIDPVPSDPHLSIPNGFSIKLYMSDLNGARFLIYTPSGDILGSDAVENRILCLLDTDNDGFPDQHRTFADATNGLDRPHGMAFSNGYFYVGNRYDIRRYVWNPNNSRISGNGTIVMNYPSSAHWRRAIVIPPSASKIYVTIGSDSDVNPEHPPLATVQEVNVDGNNSRTFASGIRNPSGIAIHPITQDIYVTCNERSELGDYLVPDYFTRIQQDDFFGWPYSFLTSNLTDPRRLLENGTSEQPDLVARTTTPDVLLQAHLAPLDIQFYTGKQFPSRYRNGAFVAIHGSVARTVAIGYKIVFIPFDSATNRPMGYYEDFVTGFLTDPHTPNAFGRPTGLLVLKDGSLIFTEDGNNRIYQVQYKNNAHCYSFASIIFLVACNNLSTFIIL